MNVKCSLFKNGELAQDFNTTGKYDKENEVLSFKDKDTFVQVRFFRRSIEFERENKEYIFKLEISGRKSTSYIKIKEHSAPFPIKVIKSSYKLVKNNLNIKYSLETDAKINNEIIIEWEDKNERDIKKNNK